jgi:hypothetical protein
MAEPINPDEWQPIETAPRGSFRKIKNHLGERDCFIRHWVDTWKEGGEVIRSCLLQAGDRWMGYSRDFPPTRWRPLPEQPQDASEA